MLTKSGNKSKGKPLESWRQADDVITHNDVIDAYLRGKQVGRDETKLAMNKLFETNLKKAQVNSEKLFATLKEMGIVISSMHLKAENLTDFMALIIASPDDYVDEKFLKAINASREIKQESSADDFNINFYFTYKADTLNEQCLDADGYFLKYYAHA